MIKVEQRLATTGKGVSRRWLDDAGLVRLSNEGQFSTPFWRMTFSDGPNTISIDMTDEAIRVVKEKLNKRKELK